MYSKTDNTKYRKFRDWLLDQKCSNCQNKTLVQSAFTGKIVCETCRKFFIKKELLDEFFGET